MQQISTSYPGNSNPPDASYPGGSVKNETVPGSSGDGTPLDAPIINDYVGFSEALISAGLVTASGASDTALSSDRVDAITNLIGIRVLQNLYGINQSDTYLYDTGLSMTDSVTAVIYQNRLYIANSTFVTTGNFAADSANFDQINIATRNIDSSTLTTEGVIEQATDSEVQNGVSGNIAVTPSGLATRTATTSRTGLVEKATNSEAQNGTVDKFIDAATLQYALLNLTDSTDRREKRNAMGIYDGIISASRTSFVVSPGTGWSVTTDPAGASRVVVTHPLGTTNVRVTAISESDADEPAEAMVNVYDKTTTSFKLSNQDSGGGEKAWPINFTVIV